MTSCEELEIDESNTFEADPNLQIPEVTSIYESINGSSVDFNWGGNDFALEFSYMVEYYVDYADQVWQPYNNWSNWTTEKNIWFYNLDEGHYTFYVKSRFDDKEEQEPYQSTDFEIDAIEGCAVRMYPLYQEITPESDFDLFVYIEECPDLMLMDLRLQYDQDELEVNDITAEDIISENTDLFETMYWDDNGNITIIAGLLNEKSIQNYNENGTAAVARIRFHAKSQTTRSQIIVDEGSSILRNINYEDIEFYGVSGTVEVIE